MRSKGLAEEDEEWLSRGALETRGDVADEDTGTTGTKVTLGTHGTTKAMTETKENGMDALPGRR